MPNPQDAPRQANRRKRECNRPARELQPTAEWSANRPRAIRKRSSGGSLWATTGQFPSWSCAAGRRRARRALRPMAAGRAPSLKSRACCPNGQRVLAVDPFYLGESKLEDRGYLVRAVGIIRRRTAIGSAGRSNSGGHALGAITIRRTGQATNCHRPANFARGADCRGDRRQRRAAAATCAARLTRQPPRNHRKQLVGRRISRAVLLWPSSALRYRRLDRACQAV